MPTSLPPPVRRTHAGLALRSSAQRRISSWSVSDLADAAVRAMFCSYKKIPAARAENRMPRYLRRLVSSQCERAHDSAEEFTPAYLLLAREAIRLRATRGALP